MKVSIITINFNDLKGLKKTIDSVQRQVYKGFELIVIDGNSSDGSKEFLQQNAHLFTHFVSEPDAGIYDAMNKGAAFAKAEYLYFLNSGDDLHGNDALDNIIDHLDGTDIVYGDINIVEGNKQTIKTAPKQLSFRYLYDDLPAHQATFVKRSLFEKIGGYDADLNIVADWKLFALAVIKYSATYKHIDPVFSNFYTGGISSQVDNSDALINERQAILEEEFPILLVDIKRQFLLERKLRNLRKSKRIQWLQRLGLLDKF
ncbi:glycosyltransferase family 2 protein [Nonlabens agnitus]|uniref:Glycosyltransferase 2-like domain-containing protein n=1 Tax=Nonlabens agnitus TaxID=870484 RepID=A0A2S9WU54_9FLAO|nr:glycosyltransferase family 2 protein [Nonlabens agnitus]PRP66998.1 hypothetical protein BST86_07745 [Nonlabens agnitus]